MSLFYNRVKFTATTTGTADFTVGAAVTGFQTPAGASVPNATPVSYTAFSANGLQWETGNGLYNTAGPTVTRVTVYDSTAGFSFKQSFTLSPTVQLDILAADMSVLNTWTNGPTHIITVPGQNIVGIGRNASVGGMNVYGGGAATPGDQNATVVIQGATASNPIIKMDSATIVGWSSSNVTQNSDVILRRAAAANLQIGDADAAAPVAQTLNVQSVVAGTSNTAGVDWTHVASKGTGTGAGGKLIFRTAPAGTTGTSQNALATGLTITAPAVSQQPSVVVGNQALATTATDGFLYIPTCAGTPTGVPTTQTGMIAMVYDTTNHQFWFYEGGAWKQPKTPAGAALVSWQ